jgi:hypothetical protein
MPWIPDLEAARQLYPRHPSAVERVPFYDGIRAWDAATLARSFIQDPRIADPRFGPVDGIDEFQRYVEQVKQWLESAVASTEKTDLVIEDDRGVEELTVHYKNGGTLAVAIATSFGRDGRLGPIRIYYGSESQPAATPAA